MKSSDNQQVPLACLPVGRGDLGVTLKGRTFSTPPRDAGIRKKKVQHNQTLKPTKC